MNSIYHIVISAELHLLKFLSVNITCSSTEENPRQETSIHLFFEGTSDLKILHYNCTKLDVMNG